MWTKTLRRFATVLGGAVLASGLLSGYAGAAGAAPGDFSKDRVIQPHGTQNLLQPTSANPGARIGAKPRIGAANGTPDIQIWTFDNTQKFGQDGKQITGGLSFVFQPTFGKPGTRPLCMDAAGDSQQPGTALELRPCDGTPSQVFVLVGDLQLPFVQNVLSGLNIEVQHGQAVLQGFVPRAAPKATLAERQALRARETAQHFLLSPESFGAGGA